MDRIALLAEADQLLHKSTFSKEDSSRVESLLRLADSITDRSDLRRATLAQHDAELGRPAPEIISAADTKFFNYLRQGKNALTPEERVKVGSELQGAQIRAAQGVGTGSTGGYTVPPSFADYFLSVLKQTDGIFELGTPWLTPTGSVSGFPMVDDIANAASVVGENTTSTEVETAYAAIAFNQTPTWRSGFMRASVELATDSRFPLDRLLAGVAAARFARGIGPTLTATLLGSAALGLTAAAQAAIAPDEIFQLIDSLDGAYLQNASFLMTRATFSAISRLKTTTNAYVFPQSVDAAGHPLLASFPVFYSPSMPALGAGAKTISFGNHSRFLRREVIGSLVFKTYVELYALLGQIAWEAFWRVDGALALGSNSPVVYLQQHA